MRHIIQKQILNIQLPHRKEAIEQQERIRQLYWERIVPALDEAFSRIVPADVYLRIDKLSLDIGDVQYENIEEEIIQQVSEQIHQTYFKTKYEANSGATLVASTSIKQTSKKQNTLADYTTTKGQQLLSKSSSDIQAVLFFLKNGIFPWWFPSMPRTTWAKLLEKVIVENRELMIQFLQTHPTVKVQKRFIRQVQTEQIFFLLQKKYPELSAKLAHLQAEASSLDSPTFITEWTKAVQTTMKQISLVILAEQPAKTVSIDAIGHVFIHRLSKKLSMSEAQLHHFFKTKIEKKKNAEMTVLPMFFEPPPPLKKETKSLHKKGTIETRTSTQPQKESKEYPTNSTKNAFEQQKQQKEIKEPSSQQNKDITKALEQGIFIPNAGLVLLAPFLPMYFEALGLVKNRQFVAVEQQERGLLLSQYLVLGHTAIAEHELILNKIITDWPLDEPPTIDLQLSTKEEQESQELWTSMLQHWGALGQTSPAGLQETFLQRAGKLVEKEEQYTLIIERKTIDILMDKIPWSYSIIKLPWMKKRIQVEW